jgi:hypothetical protein
MAKFDPQFMDIQGDGIFGLFHGDRAFERAVCGITLKGFSERSLERLIEELFDGGLEILLRAVVLVGEQCVDLEDTRACLLSD